jgi:aminopeptidase N
MADYPYFPFSVMSYLTFDENNGRKSFQLPGSRPHYNPDRPCQVQHICLDLELDLQECSFWGTCTLKLLPIRDKIDSLSLDAVDLKVDRVSIAGEEVGFNYNGEKLDIITRGKLTAGEAVEIAIDYRVDRPQRGLYFIKPDEHYPNKPTQVWTQGEDEDSRFWFPCFDYPGQLATSEIRVTVPAPYVTVSNGELVGSEEIADKRIDRWYQKEVHPTYLMTLAVGDFACLKDSWQGREVSYYVDRHRESQTRLSMGKTPQAIEFFSQKFGYPYPFPKYAQVCVDDFIFGGMENTSTTILTDRCLLDERAALDNRNTESLVVHELAHQWFGDLVVIKHWSHAWLKEGMATYSEVLWTEAEYGAEEGAYYLLSEARSYLDEDSSRYRRAIVTNVYREAIELYDRHLYEKGACVYHMIRAELGDSLFDTAIHQFVNTHAHKTVETIDLLRAIETATGHNLAYLFDQYVYRGGHPDYQVTYSWDAENNLAKLTVVQTQAKEGIHLLNSDLFDLKIPIGFGYVNENGVELKTLKIRIHQKEQVLYIPLENQPQFVSFDVNNAYLKTISLEYPLPELQQQLEKDPDPISRIHAAAAIAKKGNLAAAEILITALQNQPFWGVRVEVAKQLATINLHQAIDALIAAKNDPDARVRRTIVETLADIATPAAGDTLSQIATAGDASYYVEAAACRGIGKAVANQKDSQKAAISLLQNILDTRSGWNEVVRSGAIGGLSQLPQEPQALETICKYTAIGTPQPLRLAAIRALGTISTGQSEAALTTIFQHLTTISRETFFLTQVAVVGSLRQIENPRAISLLQNLASHTSDKRVKRMADEAIQVVLGKIGNSSAIQQLRTDFDELKKANLDLQSRLASLEAKNKSE